MKGILWSCALAGWCLLAILTLPACGRTMRRESPSTPVSTTPPGRDAGGDPIAILLCGDVMTGRGIDQILPHPGDPTLHEPYVKDARRYVELGEATSGAIETPVPFDYIWGDALAAWAHAVPDVRVINLETSITASDEHWPGKGIHYRMHPQNAPCLTAAGIDVCALANNHVLDWGYAGLAETLETLKRARIRWAGAGQDLTAAMAPAVVDVAGRGRVIVLAYGLRSSGIPPAWAAAEDKAGVNLLDDMSARTVGQVKEQVEAVARSGDVVLVSIHWGSNWGYEIPAEQVRFAHQLIDEAGVDAVHGHSSHHVKGIEVYHGRPILYGAGDLLNDYEGIGGYEGFRSDLALAYLLSVDPATGKLVELHMMPLQIKHLRLNRASRADALWLVDVLNREGQPLGTGAEIGQDNTLALRWKSLH